MIEANKEAVSRFWQEACTALAIDPACLRGNFHFGNAPEMASALAAEVTDGAKRATAGLVAEMEADNEPLPKVGDYWIVIDGAGQPAAAIQLREVRIAPFRTVDEALFGERSTIDLARRLFLAAAERVNAYDGRIGRLLVEIGREQYKGGDVPRHVRISEGYGSHDVFR